MIMGYKVYKPIVKEGDHLIRSKENPDRVRGLARDENNKNQDIIEWEEYDIDDLVNNDYDSSTYEAGDIQLTPEQEKLAREAGEALAAAVIYVGVQLFQKVISPWWKNTAWPWLKKTAINVKNAISRKKVNEQVNNDIKKEILPNKQLDDVSAQIDKAFENFYYEMDEEEAKEHIMRLIYHMLGVANEIRIISNTRISKDCESEEICIERQHEAEKFLSEKVACELDKLLSKENLRLDLNTSRELFSLTGGGVRLNGEYVPVQAIKIDEALRGIDRTDKR